MNVSARENIVFGDSPSSLSSSSSSTSSFLTYKELIRNFVRTHPIDLWKKHGWFTDDHIYDINPHWLQFPPEPEFSHKMLALLYGIIMTVGIIGNALVILMFTRCPSLRTNANILITNLAVSDFFLLSKMPIMIYNSIYYGPALGSAACKLYGFVGGLTGTVSITTLAAISLDRYYVVVYPFNRVSNRNRAKICVIFTWLYGAVFSFVPLMNVGLGDYSPEGYLTTCSFDYLTKSYGVKYYIFTFFVAAWLIPFTVITFCYVNILKAVKETKKLSESSEGSRRSSVGKGKGEGLRQSDVRLAAVVFGLVAIWFIAWTPYATVSLLGIANRADLITPLCSMIPALFCKTSSCIDPYVYAITHTRFKQELKRMFFRRNRMLHRNNTKKVWMTSHSIKNYNNRMKESRSQSLRSVTGIGDVEENNV